MARARAASDASTEWEALYALGKLWAARDYAHAGDYRRDALVLARTAAARAGVTRVSDVTAFAVPGIPVF